MSLLVQKKQNDIYQKDMEAFAESFLDDASLQLIEKVESIWAE